MSRARARRPALAPACALALACLLASAQAARAATFTVDSGLDQVAADSPSDGICDADPDPGGVSCTLRAAVQEANGTPGADTIAVPALSSGYELDLTGAGEEDAASGDLDLNESVSIEGSGQPLIDGGDADRLIDVGPDAGEPPLVSITGLDLVRGEVTGAGAEGGAVRVGSGSLELDRTTVADSAARGDGARGGGVWLGSAGPHRITASTISGNLAEAPTGAAQAGGIGSAGDATLVNVTVSGNLVLDDLAGGSALGGGVHQAAGGQMTVTQSTIADNAALSPDLAEAMGGNLSVASGGGVELRGSIVSAGLGGGGVENCFAADAGALASRGGNLEAHGSAAASQCDPRPDLGDRAAADARLAPLDNQGGPTETRALANGSPALESVPYCWPVSSDQRGLQRPSGFACDAGAFERQQPLPPDRCFGRRATMFGTAGEQRIVGTPRDDVIIALAQSDVVVAGGGDDRVCGGKGNDLVRGGAGRDLISGGMLADRLFGEGGADRLYGNFGEDLLNGGLGRDLVHGGPGRDRCRNARRDRRKSC